MAVTRNSRNHNVVVLQGPGQRRHIDELLGRHLIHALQPVSEGANDLFLSFLEGEHDDPTHDKWLFANLFALLGMEVEAQEISVGFILCRDTVPQEVLNDLDFAKLGKSLETRIRGQVHFGQVGFQDYRKIVRKMRDDIVGWVTGQYLEPVVVLSAGTRGPEIAEVRIIVGKNGARSAHEAYKALTARGDCSAMWLKPAGAIRLYRDGELFGQIMRLRDAGGWATRHVARMTEIVCHFARRARLNLDEYVCRKWIVEPSIAMSESRKGATIVIMNEAKFDLLEKNYANTRARVACKAKHAPLSKELECDPTELEFINYLSQDGAVVASPTGRLLGMGTYFRGAGNPGGRKATAEWLPTVCRDCISIVTSQDGPIYCYWPPARETRNGKELGPADDAAVGGNPAASEQVVEMRQASGVRLDFLPKFDSHPIGVGLE